MRAGGTVIVNPFWEARKAGLSVPPPPPTPPCFSKDLLHPKVAMDRGLGAVRRYFECSTGEHRAHCRCGRPDGLQGIPW